MNTLLIGDVHPEAEALLRESVPLQKVPREAFPLKETNTDIRSVVLRTFTPLKKEELEKLPSLQYVVSCSVGLDNLDLEELQHRKIELIHCPGSNANSVAEHTLYLLFSLLRKNTPFPELKGKTIGIIGLGYIGKLVARKLKGMEARVIAFDVIPIDKAVLDNLQVEMKDFDSVVKEADILTVHVPLNKHTANVINGKVFGQMKTGAFFINTSRAEVVDEEALLQAVANGKLRGLALDMCSEGFPERAQQLPGNLLITDHVAAQGEDSFREMCLQPVRLYLEKLQKRGVAPRQQ